MEPRTPAVAYYRMSSDRQESSIEDQRKSVKIFAKQNGCKIIREYTDEGISGWKEKERVAFQQMMSDLSKGDFETILCWDQDRFSRSRTLKTATYFNQLQEAGVTLATVAQGVIDFDSIGGILTTTVTAYAKHEFCKDLARNVARGMSKRRSEGKWLAQAPLGYVIGEDGRLTLGNPDATATVRRIFEQRAKGYGIHTIAKQLNKDGILSPSGKLWRYTGVSKVLEREAYLGHTVSSGRNSGKYATVTQPGGRIENTHQALITQEQWDKAQSVKVKQLRPHDRKSLPSSALAGLVYCGKCGQVMYQHRRSTGRQMFCCSTATQRGGCASYSTRIDKLEAVVFGKLRENLLQYNREKLLKIVRQKLKEQPKQIDNSKQLAKLDSQIDIAAARILTIDDSLVSDVERKLLEMKSQRERLAAQQAAIRPQLTAEQVVSKAWELDHILSTASPQEAREALSQVVESVTLHHEQTGGSERRRHFSLVGGEIRLRCTEAPTQASPGQGSTFSQRPDRSTFITLW